MDSTSLFCCFDECQDDSALLFNLSEPPIFDSEFELEFDPSKPPIFDEEYGGVFGSPLVELGHESGLIIHSIMDCIVEGSIAFNHPPIFDDYGDVEAVGTVAKKLCCSLDFGFGFNLISKPNKCTIDPIEFLDHSRCYLIDCAATMNELSCLICLFDDEAISKLSRLVHQRWKGVRHKLFWHKRMLRIRSTSEMRLGIGGYLSWLIVRITKFASLFVVFVFDPGKIRSLSFYAITTVPESSVSKLATEYAITSKCVNMKVILTTCIFKVPCSKAHKWGFTCSNFENFICMKSRESPLKYGVGVMAFHWVNNSQFALKDCHTWMRAIFDNWTYQRRIVYISTSTTPLEVKPIAYES